MAVCVHGTYKKNLESILESGLKRMKRLHVHFSCGLPTDGEVISGKLRKSYCYISLKNLSDKTTMPLCLAINCFCNCTSSPTYLFISGKPGRTVRFRIYFLVKVNEMPLFMYSVEVKFFKE